MTSLKNRCHGVNLFFDNFRYCLDLPFLFVYSYNAITQSFYDYFARQQLYLLMKNICYDKKYTSFPKIGFIPVKINLNFKVLTFMFKVYSKYVIMSYGIIEWGISYSFMRLLFFFFYLFWIWCNTRSINKRLSENILNVMRAMIQKSCVYNSHANNNKT